MSKETRHLLQQLTYTQTRLLSLWDTINRFSSCVRLSIFLVRLMTGCLSLIRLWFPIRVTRIWTIQTLGIGFLILLEHLAMRRFSLTQMVSQLSFALLTEIDKMTH